MSNESRVTIDALIGQVIQDRYRVLRTLGKGALGTVYVAEQLNTRQRVALKILHGQYARDEEFRGRFRSEAQQTASLRHPRVAAIHEIGQLGDGSLFIAAEYTAGKTLRELLQEALLPVGQAVALSLQIAEALQAAHKVGLIHRAVKPENIKVREWDDIKLLDLGIARPRDAEMQTHLARTGMFVGTPEYTAPEQIQGGKVTEQTDIYAWGVVLYELLTGAVPFSAPTPEGLFAKHLQEMPQPVRKLRAEVPALLERVVMQALEKKPENRQRNMGEVIAQLRGETVQVTGTASPGVAVDSRPRQVAAPDRTWWFRRAALLGAVVVSVGVAWFVASRKGGDLSTDGGSSRGAESAPVAPEAPQSPVKTRETEPAQVSIPQPSSPAQPEKKPAVAEEKNPEIADHLRLGTFYLDRGQYEEAIAEFEAAKALAPDDQEVLARLARTQKAIEAEKRIRRTQ